MPRGFKATKSTNWAIVLSGFFEPVFFLLAMGLGLGTYIGDVELPDGTSSPTRPSSRRPSWPCPR